MQMRNSNTSPHYGWVVVLAGMMAIFACLGLGRFTLGMMLPSMAQGLSLNYAQMGFVGTVNFLGYMVAVLAGGTVAARLGARVTVTLGLLLIASTMVLVGLSGAYWQILVLYTLTGIGSGAANVPVMGLVSTWFSRKLRGRAAGFIVIGSGFAILLSGRIMPMVNERLGAEGWRANWIGVGLTVAVVAAVCYRLIRNRPQDMGLEQVGQTLCRQSQECAHQTACAPAPDHSSQKSLYRTGAMYHLGAIYFLFGCTYVVFATFAVTTLVRERGYTEAAAGGLWSWVGVLSLLSGPVFGTLSDRIGRRAGLAIVYALHTASYGLMASGLGGWAVYGAIICYGVSVFSIPSIMAAAVGDYVGALRATHAFGFITFIFAIGQVAGPAVAGVLAQSTGSFSGSFALSAVLTAAAVGLSLMLKGPKAG